MGYFVGIFVLINWKRKLYGILEVGGVYGLSLEMVFFLVYILRVRI